MCEFGSNENDIIAVQDGYPYNEMNIIFLFDTSGSMAGRRIFQVNDCMWKLMYKIQDFESEWMIKIRLRVIEFNYIAKWILGDPIHAAEYLNWKSIDATIGTTNTAEAIKLARQAIFNELCHQDRVMHRHSTFYNYPPIIVLVTDGRCDNPEQLHDEIARLNVSSPLLTKVAIGVDSADIDELNAFASIGRIKCSDGTTKDDVRLSFYIPEKEEDQISNLLEQIVCSAMDSSRIYGRLSDWRDREYKPTICFYEITDDPE